MAFASVEYSKGAQALGKPRVIFNRSKDAHRPCHPPIAGARRGYPPTILLIKRIDAVYGSYMLKPRLSSCHRYAASAARDDASRTSASPYDERKLHSSNAALTTFNSQSSVIVRVRGPLVRWDRRQLRGRPHADGAIADGGSGSLAFRRFLSVHTILSRRSVRRHNAVAARAFIAVHRDEVASLLP